MSKILIAIIITISTNNVFAQKCDEKLSNLKALCTKVICEQNGKFEGSQKQEFERDLRSLAVNCDAALSEKFKIWWMNVQQTALSEFCKFGISISNEAKSYGDSSMLNSNNKLQEMEQILNQFQYAQKQNSFEQGVKTVQNVGIKIAQNSAIDMRNILIKEQELLKILSGNEAKYPLAVTYYNEYLKTKKRQKTLLWTGIGVTSVSLVPIAIAFLTTDDYTGEFNESLMYGGVGLASAGLGITIFSIAPSKKGKKALEKARQSLSFTGSRNGIGLVYTF